MRCLVVTVTRNRRGLPIRDGRIVSGDALAIGRGSDCAIYLPNARVNLRHANLRTQEDGRLVIEAESVPVNVNGSFVQRAHLRPDTRIVIGPYLIVVELAGAEGYPEHDFALSIEYVQSEALVLARKRRRPLTLAETWLGKRIPSLALAVVIGVAFLVWPILHATAPASAVAPVVAPVLATAPATVPAVSPVVAGASALPVAADASWSPGPLAAGHRGFGNDCKSCHVLPFVHVRDQECQSCHETTGPHVRDVTLQKAAFGTTRCAECHRDHRGLASMNDIDPVLCVQCHGAIRAHAPSTTLPDISDFKDGHPPFRFSIRTGPKADDIVRVAATASSPLHQNTGLKFPHDVHLAARGVESHSAPAGQNGRVRLDCHDCHVADPSGVGFLPVSMEKHCADCHRLEFEPGLSSRQVPHGSVKNVLLMLREFYGSAALGITPVAVTTDDGLLRRSGPPRHDVRLEAAQAYANRKAAAVATDLIEVRVCIVCHEVSRVADPDPGSGQEGIATMDHEPVTSAAAIAIPWRVAPVILTEHWLPKARFEHSRHLAVACQDCHDVARSKSGADVSMPAIAKCRECHVGAVPERDKISSNCELCHGFHRHLAPVPSGIDPTPLQQKASLTVATPVALGTPDIQTGPR